MSGASSSRNRVVFVDTTIVMFGSSF